MTDMTVANTIRRQLGGNRFDAMTGAKNWVGDAKSVQFSIGRNQSKCNKIRITLDATDTYTVDFYHYTTPGFNLKTGEMRGGAKLLKTVSVVYADSLQEVFTSFTGLHTSI